MVYSAQVCYWLWCANIQNFEYLIRICWYSLLIRKTHLLWNSRSLKNCCCWFLKSTSPNPACSAATYSSPHTPREQEWANASNTACKESLWQDELDSGDRRKPTAVTIALACATTFGGSVRWAVNIWREVGDDQFLDFGQRSVVAERRTPKVCCFFTPSRLAFVAKHTLYCNEAY